ncbi:hypothetical protein HKX48_000885 [Thoreauomyces humboldtii]|nr:hypothetical protein HKX48_000885 [Thoreauomyces humboldtii]
MAAQIVDFLTSKIDPLQFFASSSSSTSSSIAPYTLSPASAFSDFSDPANADLASFALRNYVLAVLTSPLQLVETLAEVQYQRREGDDDHVVVERQGSELGVDEPAEHQLPPLQDGVWDNLREIVESDGEGWTSLLKGHFTNFSFNASFAILQPTLEEAINDAFDVYEDTHPATLIASHVIVGGLLSPLELVRTRLIVQPSSSSLKKYYGPFHALHAVTTEEPTGFASLYSLRHLIPSLIISGLSPFLRLVSRMVIAERLGLDPTFTPALHHLATLALMAVEVGIVSPFEMARKRIQVQRMTLGTTDATRGPQAFSTSVQVSPRYYSGIMDCIASIVTGEGGRNRTRRPSLPPVPSPSASSSHLTFANEWHQIHDADADYRMYEASARRARGGRSTGLVASVGRFASGVRTLYRGFWARYATRVVVYAFDEISQADDTW